MFIDRDIFTSEPNNALCRHISFGPVVCILDSKRSHQRIARTMMCVSVRGVAIK